MSKESGVSHEGESSKDILTKILSSIVDTSKGVFYGILGYFKWPSAKQE